METPICVPQNCPVVYKEQCDKYLKQVRHVKCIKINYVFIEYYCIQINLVLPQEHCEMKPKRECRVETKLVPSMKIGSQCLPVPRISCEKMKSPFTQIVKQETYNCRTNATATTAPGGNI